MINSYRQRIGAPRERNGRTEVLTFLNTFSDENYQMIKDVFHEVLVRRNEKQRVILLGYFFTNGSGEGRCEICRLDELCPLYHPSFADQANIDRALVFSAVNEEIGTLIIFFKDDNDVGVFANFVTTVPSLLDAFEQRIS